jgi:type II secretory pathway component PulF
MNTERDASFEQHIAHQAQRQTKLLENIQVLLVLIAIAVGGLALAVLVGR